MQFSQEFNRTSYTIRSYSVGRINISAPFNRTLEQPEMPVEEVLTESFIMTPSRLIRNWPPQSVADICADHLETAARLEPEVLIIGTGGTLEFPDMKLTYALMEQGIGVEIMDTAAACRTYNVLMHEGRRVALALVIR
ncbi:MAG: Mth938-like domain-containing protein [Gammaproteobacteria bacterium]|nr:Mth938-like domain-containing protein [Gammaproteobacteria bacterium]